MFASLKNKIREETGSDISKLTAKITASTAQKFESLRAHRSHQGSTSSINSIVSSEAAADDCSNESLKSEDDYRRRLSKVESEYGRKLEDKERELQELISEKEGRIRAAERERDEAKHQASGLKDSLRIAECFQQKLVEHQEDKAQIENLQSQELSQVKHLVHLREQELSEKSLALKEASVQLEKMRNEVNRLRRQEERLSDVQDDLESLRHSSARDLASLASQLAKSEEERRHLADLVAVLRQRDARDDSESADSNQERKLLERRLEEAHLHLQDIKTSWSEKIASLETQVGRLSRQAAEESAERRRAVEEKEVLGESIRQMECELECNRLDLNNKESKIKRLTAEIEDLSREVKALRIESEEEVSFLRKQIQDTGTEVKIVRKNLENAEGQLERSEDERGKLRLSLDSEQQSNTSLRNFIAKLEKELAEEKGNSLNVQKTLTRVTAEKNSALVRNAEISQQMEMAKQESRKLETETNELSSRISQLEDEIKVYREKENKNPKQELKNRIASLEEQLEDKNKNIRNLQLRLADMKKTLQQELRTSSTSAAAVLMPSQISTRNLQHNTRKDEDDINFKYLKHVLIKFLTSREYEAIHLIKAISTLLKLSVEEEKLLHETLEWKMSWFGSKPKLGNGTKGNLRS